MSEILSRDEWERGLRADDPHLDELKDRTIGALAAALVRMNEIFDISTVEKDVKWLVETTAPLRDLGWLSAPVTPDLSPGVPRQGKNQIARETMAERPAATVCDWIVSAGLGSEQTCDKIATLKFDTGKPSNAWEPNPADICECHAAHARERGWKQISYLNDQAVSPDTEKS